MKGVIRALTHRQVIEIAGVMLLCLVIWFAGPYVIAHGWLDSAVTRLVLILIVVIGWAISAQWRHWRSARASDQLARGMAVQEEAAPARTAPETAAADDRLRQGFDEALAELKRMSGGQANLYSLPWYVMIGPPGSGKTTALLNSGLKFASKGGAIAGVGGTRNCDWWLSERAVLLDTAGRYTTQDSQRATDNAQWHEFLGLIRRARPRRPVNGVLVAISVSDLLMHGDEEMDATAEAIRARIGELTDELGLQIPVYLLLTKADLIAGFTECLGDLTREERNQVWGVTFPLDATRQGEAHKRLEPEFDSLLRQLGDRILSCVQGERDSRRRAAVFAFPEQVAGLRSRLVRFTHRVCAGNVDAPVWLRGVYLTSATQEGTAIDRLVASLGRSFGISVEASSVPPLAGKAYFLGNLVDVILQESGLAGVSRRMERRHALMQAAIGVAAILVGLAGVSLLAISYRLNQAYLADVAEAAATLKEDGHTPDGGLKLILLRLDRLRQVADAAAREGRSVPWTMRWGLYQGGNMEQATRAAYFHEMNGPLLSLAGKRLEQRMGGLAADPGQLYAYLKGYLMLTDPSHVERDFLARLAHDEWSGVPGWVAEDTVPLDRHFDALIADRQLMGRYIPNPTLIDQARVSLNQASVPRLMYQRLAMSSSDNVRDELHLEKELGIQSEQVYVRRSGKPLSAPVPALYTQAGFTEFLRSGQAELAANFLKDAWIFGPGKWDPISINRMTTQVIGLYEADYIRAWDGLLADLSIRSATSVPDTADLLAILGGGASPLRRLLEVVKANTDLAKTDAQQPEVAGAAKAALADKAAALLGRGSGPVPGESVSLHFKAINALVEGSPAPIDRTLAALGQAAEKLRSLDSSVGQGGALSGVSSGAATQVQRILSQEASQLPPAVGGMLSAAGNASGSLVATAARSELGDRYREMVVRQCRELLAGRYPFSHTSPNDAALADVARVFGTGGIFDQFYMSELASLVDATRATWAWREGGRAVGAGTIPLSKFQEARRIRDALFGTNSQTPEFQFLVSPEILDRQARQFNLEVEGQSFQYSFGPTNVSKQFVWPGKGDGAGLASVSWDEQTSPLRQSIVRNGPWALFRLLDEGRIEPLGGLKYRISFALAGHSQTLILVTASALNPLSIRTWQQFSCD